MAVNILVLIFISFLGWLLYKFKHRKTLNPHEIKKTLWVSIVFSVLLLLNGVLAYNAFRELKNISHMRPLRSIDELASKESHLPVIVEGFLGSENPVVRGNYVAYMDGNKLYSPKTLVLNLSDGNLDVYGWTYTAKNWEVDYSRLRYIIRGQVITVAGKLMRTQRKDYITGQTEDYMYVDPEIVYSGTKSMMKARVSIFIPLAIALTAINILAALAVTGYPFIHYVLCKAAAVPIKKES